MLTQRQRQTFEFIRRYIGTRGFAPKLMEIADGIGIRSKGVVYRHIKALAMEGMIELVPGRHRGIRISRKHRDHSPFALSIPVLGRIEAGKPIEAIPALETIDLAETLLGPNRYALKVSGDSMVEAGILSGDVVIVEPTDQAKSGDIVVALIDQTENTLKRIELNENGTITLLPANQSMKSITYAEDRVTIQGVVVGQFRSYLSYDYKTK